MMKKLTAALLMTSLFFVLSACSKDNAGLGANVEVKVTNLLNQPQKGKFVYLFMNEMPDKPKPADAKKQATTDDSGVAFFRLNLTELKIFESQTSLYFGVFYTVLGQEFLAGSNAVTVQRSDVKKIDVKIPL
jgi:predicted small secreted protein